MIQKIHWQEKCPYKKAHKECKNDLLRLLHHSSNIKRKCEESNIKATRRKVSSPTRILHTFFA